MAELTGRQPDRERWLATLVEKLVGALEGAGEDALSQVVLVAGAAGAGGKHRSSGDIDVMASAE